MDWQTSDGWQGEAWFEPLGAISKRCRYTLDTAKHYRFGFMKNINGKNVRAYTEGILGSDIGTPINGVIEITVTIPTTQRDLEYWIFPAE